ncbi:unnamed protein product, partial [Effrenium voratum]
MKALCKPLRCLSFLGGRKPPEQYSAAEGQHLAKSADDEDDEDDFFGDSWGESANGSRDSSASQTKEAEAQRSGVDRNPTRETTTKRPGGVTEKAKESKETPKASAKKQEADFFNELGMEPEYRAPRTLPKAAGPSVNSLLDEGEVTAAWGDDDLDLCVIFMSILWADAGGMEKAKGHSGSGQSASPEAAVKEDKHMAVLSKSAGWIVAISRHKEQNKYFDKLLQESAVREAKELVDSGRCEHLCHFIALKFKEDSSFQLSNNLSCEWGIAHRLDVDTSGAIMIGKTAEGFRHLREAFSSHVVFKEYLCLVHGAVKESSGEVNQPILWDCSTNTSCISSSGDWAQTFFTRVGHYRLKGGNQVFSLCRIVIVTGRTHQIRVHMASIGHPLVSDGKYNSKNKTDLMWCPRMFLHAWRLGFYDLFYTWQEVRTSLPSDLRKALRMLSEIKIDVMRPDDPSCRVIHASRPQEGTKRKAEASTPE